MAAVANGIIFLQVYLFMQMHKHIHIYVDCWIFSLQMHSLCGLPKRSLEPRNDIEPEQSAALRIARIIAIE